MKSNSQSKAALLGTLLKELDAWAIGSIGTKYNPLNGSLREYPRWAELSVAFIGFLRSKPIEDWGKRDSTLVKNAVKLDWAYHRLLGAVPDNDLFDILTVPYYDDVVRMYMLVRGGQVKTQPIRDRIALYFFEHDASDAVRDAAFEILARGKWKLTEKYAKIWWDSGDIVKRMVSLKVLQASESSQLDSYLSMAADSGDKILRSVADSITKTSE